MMNQLFQQVVENNPTVLAKLLAADSLRDRDLAQTMHGYTILSLAIALNRKECTAVLIASKKVNALAKTSDGWSAFQEAVSIGDRDIIRIVFQEWRRQLGMWFADQGKQLLETLSKDLSDFYLEMKWEFSSWIPFLAQWCPSDVCKIRKRGTNVRIDTTLVGFESFSWIRGDVSIIFSKTQTGPRLVICDHQRRVVQQVYPQDFTLSETDLEEEISIALNSPLVTPPEFNFSKVETGRVQSGLVFKADRIEQVNQYTTTVWNLQKLSYSQKSRHEHLSVHPLPPNYVDDYSTAQESIAFSQTGHSEKNHRHLDNIKLYRPSLDPPLIPAFTWLEFLEADNSAVQKKLTIGRMQDMRVSTKNISATLWMHNSTVTTSKLKTNTPNPATAVVGMTSTSMTDIRNPGLISWIGKIASNSVISGTSFLSKPLLQVSNMTGHENNDKNDSKENQQFPVKLSTLLPLLDLMGMGSNEHIRALRDFLTAKLPPGFPVKIEIPINVLPLSAVVTFQNVTTSPEFQNEIFIVPGRRMGYVCGEVFAATNGSAGGTGFNGGHLI
ncbi:hypothetical protein HK100_007410 [Physocladia obscura]|uniref:Ankyrin repeat domain-containing protein n=1 Tax=Physocladia obscura TaxID=109957 RepID=A0AAD5SQF3_9FUNG|nr:hypothetical protein HK100_007410 [Physocladia obscura]